MRYYVELDPDRVSNSNYTIVYKEGSVIKRSSLIGVLVEVSEEFYKLANEFMHIQWPNDVILTGVLADFMEDYREVVAQKATPTQLAVYDGKILYLRRRFQLGEPPQLTLRGVCNIYYIPPTHKEELYNAD